MGNYTTGSFLMFDWLLQDVKSAVLCLRLDGINNKAESRQLNNNVKPYYLFSWLLLWTRYDSSTYLHTWASIAVCSAYLFLQLGNHNEYEITLQAMSIYI